MTSPLTHTCPQCGTQFEGDPNQRCCSRSCSTKMQRVRQGVWPADCRYRGPLCPGGHSAGLAT